MAKSYNVENLQTYVEEQNELLIGKTILGSKSADLFTLITGVKGPSALNILDTDVEFGDGKVCGWADAGEASLSQRLLTPAYLKVNMSICDKNLLGYWGQYEVKVAAGKTAADLPFEAELMDTVITGINKKLEEMIWKGTKSDTSFDGILTILNGAGEVTVNGADAYAVITNAIAKLPAEAIDTDTVVFVGEDTYRTYMQQLVEKNLYHYNPENGADGYMHPGTSIRVIGVPGLNGTQKVVAGRLSNFFYGVDLEGDKDTLDLWYSKDNREFRLAVEFLAGVQIAFPKEVVVGTIE